jgi:hypothetical protein
MIDGLIIFLKACKYWSVALSGTERRICLLERYVAAFFQKYQKHYIGKKLGDHIFN